MPIMSEVELKMDYQARSYMRFAKDRWPGFSSYRFSLHAVRFAAQVSVTFNDEELDQIEREILADIAVYEEAKRTDNWPAIPGPACRFCSLRCPLLDNLPTLMPKRLTSVEQAQKLAGFILAAEGIVKAAKKTLKEHVSANGPISVNGVVWANRKSEQRIYPLMAVLEVLKLNNLAGVFEDSKQDALTVSHSALAKLFKQHPVLEEQLSAYMTAKPIFRFSARQPGDEEDGE
jgi:hypothetical protein